MHNKSNKMNKRKIIRGSAEIPKIQSDLSDKINKKYTISSGFPYNLKRVRLNTLSEKRILSPCGKSRKIYEYSITSDLLSIKENEDCLISSFEKDNEENNENEENEEKDFFFKEVYSNKTVNIFNFEESDINNTNSSEIKRIRSCSVKNKNKSLEIKEKKHNRNNSEKNKTPIINNYH